MDTSKHTVTIPISDYDELLKTKNEHSYMTTTLREIMMECHEWMGYEIKNKDSGFIRIIEMCESAKKPF